MKTKKLLGLGSWVLGLGWLTLSVFGQGTPIATTATTRALLRATNSADFRLQLGFLSTNNTVITNYVGNGASITNLNADELRSGTVPLARLSGITATQIANDTLTTNKVDSTFYNLLTNTASGGSSLQTGNATDAANINLTVTGTLVAATQTNTTLSVGSAYFGYTNVGATFSAEGKLVGTNGVTQAGLAAGSYAVSGNGRNLTNLFSTNMWMTTTLRAPWWTTEVFGSGFLHKMRDPDGNAFMQLRRDSSVRENNAVYLGDFDNTNAWSAVTIQAASSRLNLDPRITFVFVGTLTNGSGAETVINPSWQFHETNFGADYINWDTLEHTRLDVITHNYSNTFWLGYTNFATILIGTNITASTNVTILGSLNPAGGIIGNRSIATNANPQLNTLYTNTSKRAWFTTSISVAGGGDDNVLEVVTYAQGGATNRWSRIRLNDGVSTVFLDACFPISVPLNPNEVFYLDRISGLAGNYTINTNTWKIVSE